MDVKRGSLWSDLQRIIVTLLATHERKSNNHGLKLKTSVFQSDDKNKKLTVTTVDADTRARRMGDIFVPENGNLSGYFHNGGSCSDFV